jgi:hypothetical protein
VDGGGFVSYAPPLCSGTVAVSGAGINSTIEEVLASPKPDYVDDQVDNGSIIDWACVLDQRVEYLGPRMQVTQLILFWGDPIIIRQINQ